MTNQPLIEIKNLNYSYAGPSGSVPVLRDVSLSIQKGEFISILGPSGGGKSTFLNLIGGLEKVNSGKILVNGNDISMLSATELDHYRQTEVSFVFQFFNLLPTLTAYENVLLAMEAMDHPPVDAQDRASMFLINVGLEGKLDRFPSQLSGGEQQRVAIARALAKGAPLILADEPTGNLDEVTATQVIDLIVKVQRESGATLLLITHDMSVATRANRIVQLVKGQMQTVNFEEKIHATNR